MYPPERITTPDPLPASRPLLARTVTTDGSARSATDAAAQAAAVPFDGGAVAVAELPSPDPHVARTISPPTTPPMIAAATSPMSAGTMPTLRPAPGPPILLAAAPLDSLLTAPVQTRSMLQPNNKDTTTPRRL